MLRWMIYVAIVSLVLSIAALSAERALRLRRAATRWVWISAIVASLLIPAVIASVSFRIPKITAAGAPPRVIVLRNATSIPLTALSQWPLSSLTSQTDPGLDARLKRYWLIASAAMLVALAASATQLAWRQRRWPRATVAGATVHTAPEVGPAVVGLIRPRIVVPPWVVESSPSVQAHVIAHEQSHLVARDPLLLTTGWCLLVLMPWNLVLWWQLRRLRRAIEVDCDARVLSMGHDVNRYGETLIEIGQRQSGFVGSVAAMSESRSFLEHRIRIMLRKPGRWGKMSAAVLGCASVCLIAVATQLGPPNSAAAGSLAHEEIAVDPTVYDDYVGHYQFDESSFLTLSRDGNRLLTRVTGQNEVEIFPTSRTEFFAKLINAKITFETDAHGHATALTLHQNGRETRAARVDDQIVESFENALKARIQSQAPAPGSEAALRRYYAGLTARKPVYDEMTPLLAEMTRQNLVLVESIPMQLGAIQSVEFRGVGPLGRDIYSVHHERGLATWRIAMSPSGKIEYVIVQAWP